MKDRLGALVKGRGLRIFSALAISLPLIFLGYNLYHNWHDVISYGWSVNYAYVALSFVLYSLALGLAIRGWGSIMEKLGGPCSFRKNARIYCLSNLARRLPGTLWFIAGRIYWYEKEGVAKSITSAGVLWEMILMILSGLLVYLLSLPLCPDLRSAGSSYLLLLSIPLGIAVIHPTALGISLNFLLKKLGRGQVPINKVSHKDTLRWLLLYSLVWIIGGFILYLFTNAFHPLPAIHLPALTGIWALSGVTACLVFFVPAGLGIKEVTLALLLSRYFPLPVATIIALLLRLWLTLSELVWTFVYVRIQKL